MSDKGGRALTNGHMLVGVEGGHDAHAQNGHGHQAKGEPLKVHATDHCWGEVAHVGLQLILDQAARPHSSTVN